MNERINRINLLLEPLKQQIVNHKLYESIKTIEDLHVFMEFHVFAVWDFMSLLKSLQNNLTCTTTPWVPIGDAETRFLINEIVVGEESDVDMDGNRKSHFELYLDAMHQAGANTETISKFIACIRENKSVKQSIQLCHVHQAAEEFVNFTFNTIASFKNHLLASVFTFGREDLIPDMFYSIVADIDKISPNKISVFKYYLERHIEVDGGHHGILAIRMIEKLCGSDDELWQEVENIAIQSLQKRIELWDGIYEQLNSKATAE